MKRTFSGIDSSQGLSVFQVFFKESANYEQITFDYFVSDIFQEAILRTSNHLNSKEEQKNNGTSTSANLDFV